MMDVYTILWGIAGLVVVFFVTRWFLRKLQVGQFKDRYVFITGCDSGFGNHLAKRLDRIGFNVFAGCLSEQGATELRKVLSSKSLTVELDISKQDDVYKAVEFIKSRLPQHTGLWSVVNNAGIAGPVGHAEWISVEDHKKVFEVNYFGMVTVNRAFLPLVRLGLGRIVNMASIMGRIGLATAAYSGSKYAVEGYSDVLRYQLKKCGVSVHIIEPGYFSTGIVSNQSVRDDFQKSYDQLTPEIRQYYGQEYLQEVSDNACNMLDKFLSPDVYKVVDAYTHAVTARFPKARYVVGTDANTLFRVLWNLPEWLATYLVSKGMPVPVGARK